ncbi:MAG: pSer/pThr/pTyr-binding forkhead associated (FHA) protein/tetratricopeptide (TPR) repeat protein, partial [Myxococcota bacterium]
MLRIWQSPSIWWYPFAIRGQCGDRVLKLHIQDEEGKTTIVPLVRDEITIGRREGNTIRLTERNVSRNHARLVRLNGGMFLEEVSARFGTRINGEHVDGRTSVLPGDVIEIGDYRLALHTQGDAALDNTLDGELASPLATPDGAMRGVGQSADGSTSLVDLEDIGELLDDDNERDIPASEHATLTIVSTNVQRQVYTLTRSPMIIGRTSENDIAVDHRSISRNHAKILWAAGTYTLVDLGSANGVKVNADFYKRSDLHSGDEVELGHVGLKFEMGNASPLADLPVAEYAPAAANKLLMMSIVVVGVLIAALWFFHFSKDPAEGAHEPKTPPTRASEQPEAGSTGTAGTQLANASKAPVVVKPVAAKPAQPKLAEPVAKPAEPVAKPAEPVAKPVEPVAAKPVVAQPAVPEAPVQSADEQAKALMGEASAAFDKGDFGTARARIESAAKADPNVAGAEDLRERINQAETARFQLNKAKASAKGSEWGKVWDSAQAGLKDAEKGSSTAADLAELRDSAAEELAAAAVKRGEGHHRSKRYQEAVSAFRSALNFDPDNTAAKAGQRRAQRQLRASASKPRTPSKPKTPKVVKAPKEPSKPAAKSKLDQAKALEAEAKAAKRAANLGLAESKFRACLKMHSGMTSCRGDLAVLLMARGKRCEALKHMRRYVKARPGSSKSAQFRRLIETFEPQC